MLIFLRLGVIGGILSLGALLGSQHLVFDLISHFRIQYIALIIVFLCLAVYLKRILFAAVLGICLAVHTYAVYESQVPHKFIAKGKGTALTVMSSNLLVSNDHYVSHINFIQSVDPDVIVFQEYTTAWNSVLSRALTNYPNQLTVPMSSAFGIAIYSKIPFLEENIIYLVDSLVPSVDVTLSNGEENLRVLGTHPPSPTNVGSYKYRNNHLRKISELAQTQTDPMLVVGDLNISPWSTHFRHFLDNGKLFDGRASHGILPTWPSGFLPLQIPIDYIVVNSQVKVVSMKTSNALNSDHRALWAVLEY